MLDVISLFDGIGGARQALANLNIQCSYVASEIDKNAIQIAKNNFPDICELGDINGLHWELMHRPYLLIGGSPCQNLSSAGNGEGLSGQKSQLFWKFVEGVRTLKPKYFIFENVASMVGDTKDRISNELGCLPVMIDSGLVSAQRRPRYYWCNFPVVEPTDMGFRIGDILDPIQLGVPTSCFVNERLEETYKLIPDGGCWRELPDGNIEKQKIIDARDRAIKSGKIMGGQSSFFRKYGMNEKCPCLTASGIRQTMTRIVWYDERFGRHRYPTVTECEKLQTFPIGYTHGVKESERFKALGNSFTVKVIEEILKGIL